MKIKFFIALLCMFYFLSPPSLASNWYWIGQSGDGSNIYIDNSSVEKNSSRAIMWILVTNIPHPNEMNAVKAMFRMYVLSNGSGGWTYMQLQHPDGSIMQYNNDLEIHPFPPDSIGYKVWQSTY